jgi:hypothetical protein
MSEQAAGVAVEPAHPSSLVISAMLAEYHALRQESLNATTNRMTIASFSFLLLRGCRGGPGRHHR